MSGGGKLRKLGELNPEATEWLFTRQEEANSYLNRICWVDKLRRDWLAGNPNPDELGSDNLNVTEPASNQESTQAENAKQDSTPSTVTTPVGRPAFELSLRPEVSSWVYSQSDGYLDATILRDKELQTARPSLPSGAVLPIKLKLCPDGEPDFPDAQEQFFSYVVQLFCAAPDEPKSVNAGSGCLVEYKGKGYLATCAHTMHPGNLRYVIPYLNKELTNELATYEIFGTPKMDSQKDLAYFPILKPEALITAGLRFLPLIPASDSETELLAVTGYPGALMRNLEMHPSHQPGEDLVQSVSIAITAIQDKQEAARPVINNHPFSTLGFKVFDTWFEDALGEDIFPLPGSVKGMSGGPIWALRRDGTVKLGGILTLETTNDHVPKDLWGVPSETFTDFLEAAEHPPDAT